LGLLLPHSVGLGDKIQIARDTSFFWQLPRPDSELVRKVVLEKIAEFKTVAFGIELISEGEIDLLSESLPGENGPDDWVPGALPYLEIAGEFPKAVILIRIPCRNFKAAYEIGTQRLEGAVPLPKKVFGKKG